MTFKDLGIIPQILKAINDLEYVSPSDIQREAIPVILKGSDVLGSALTGTGKTAAFAIPILQQLFERAKYGDRPSITALILAPTRELSEQIKDSFVSYNKYLPFKIGAIYGGVSQKRQELMLDRGVDILVATPGRLIDLVKQKIVNLNNVRTFVLDEADTMLDMGFIKDVEFINSLMKQKEQTLMFSATIKSDVETLASELLKNPVRVETAEPEDMLETISHSLYMVEKLDKRDALLTLLSDRDMSSVLVFMKTKHGANKLNTFLHSYGVKSDVIHSNKSQASRQAALNAFKENKIRVLVATDIAARGIDIYNLSHVVNFDVPLTTETYIHRIGRTGRAGLLGQAITLCASHERVFIKAIEKESTVRLARKELPTVDASSALVKLENFTPPARPNFQAQKEKAAVKPKVRNKPKKKKDPLMAEALKEDAKNAKNHQFKKGGR